MTAVVVADQAAETSGMTLVERAEPQAAINDVIIQLYGSGIRPDSAGVALDWTDRFNRDRTPSVPAVLPLLVNQRRPRCEDRPWSCL